MRFLVGTDSVHTTAAICDYLDERVTNDDHVTVIAAYPENEDATRRDGQEALNVAPVRLVTVGNVETELRMGSPASTLLEAAAEFDADEVIIGNQSGSPDSSAGGGVGSTAQALLEGASRPVVVVPVPELE